MRKKIAITLLVVSTSIQAQTCDPAKTRNAPDSIYTVQAGGAEVLDTTTGLIWKRCSLGQSWSGSTCTGSPSKYSLDSAIQAARDLGNGWRLPNLKELASLVEDACTKPSINETLFPATVSDDYWVSLPSANDRHPFTRSVYFDNGGAYEGYDYKGLNFYVRVVRSGQ